MASYVRWLAKADEPDDQPAEPLAPPRTRGVPPVRPATPPMEELGADTGPGADPQGACADTPALDSTVGAGTPNECVGTRLVRRLRSKTHVACAETPTHPTRELNNIMSNSGPSRDKRPLKEQGARPRKSNRCADVPLKDLPSLDSPPLSAEIENRRHLPGLLQHVVQALGTDAIAQGFRDLSTSVVASAASGGLHFRLGSLCSGSEMYLSALPHLCAAVEKLAGLRVSFTHAWSCELVRKKREWIWFNFKPPLVYTDATLLCDPEGGFDDVTQTRQILPTVDIVVAGFSCKDASRASIHHGSRLDVVSTGGGTTGRTFQALLRVVAKLRPGLVLMENVPTLADIDKASGLSNLDRVKLAFDEIDYALVFHCFDVADVGVPNTRRRLYMTAWPRPSPYRREQLLRGVADGVEAVCAEAPQIALDAILLPEECVLAWRGELDGTGAHEGLLKRAEWRQHHQDMWSKAPHAADRDRYLARVSESPAFGSLSMRQKDLLLLCLCKHPYPGPVEGVVLLNPSAQWTRIAATMPTQLPKSVFWLLSRNRLQLGVEAIALQGADIVDLPACRPNGIFPDKFMQDLAGNAFHVLQFSVWFLVCVAKLPLAKTTARGI